MSQSSPADAARPDALPGQRDAGSALAPSKRRLVWLLIALVAVPAVLGLVLAGLQVTDAARSAGAYGQVGQLAMLGRQVNGLAQAMEDERSGTYTFIADGRPAAGLPALHRQYAITNGLAAGVRRSVLQLGHGYPAQIEASAATVLASIAELPGLRRRATQSPASALALMNGYSAATAGLFPLNDSIADLSGNSALTTSVRALGSLSRMVDQASQQRVILGVALAQGHFGPGALTALLIAQARQAGDLVSFRNSANPEESWALTRTLADPLPRQAQAVEQRAIGVGDGALALGPQASHQWSAGMSYTVGWMRYGVQQLNGWITSYAQAQQRSAVRSAIITGGAALAALVAVVLATLMAARSMLRRLRRLETAAQDANREAADRAWEQAQMRTGTTAISDRFFQRSHSLLERLLPLIDNAELREDDPERLANLFEMDHLATRMWRHSDSALVLAGHEKPHQPTEPLSLVDVLRAAVSEIEQYDRVVLNVQQGVLVCGSASTDTVHLLAELLENATGFSPEASQVIVSGHMARGGSLISVTDAGPGIPGEQLRQLNRRLAHPSYPSAADVAVAPSVGLFAVAHLAARHGITVKLSAPPDGGTTAEVSLPAALISPDSEPGSMLRLTGGALSIEDGEEAEAWEAAAELPFSDLRFAAGPEPPLERETGTPEAVPLMAAAPVPSPGPDGVPRPEPKGPDLGDPLPIFESVEADRSRPQGQGVLQPSDPQAGQPTVADQETRQATAAEPAEITRDRLASLQQGSRRGREVAQIDRGRQPGRG